MVTPMLPCMRLVFQSSLPRGERRSRSEKPAPTDHISILAPTRGATCFPMILQSCGVDFNPRSHEGSDCFFIGQQTQHIRFQSSLPRGERPSACMESRRLTNFNPRSHEGSDDDTTDVYFGTSDFNPRSHEGSDIIENNNSRNSIISILAPTRGATIYLYSR